MRIPNRPPPVQALFESVVRSKDGGHKLASVLSKNIGPAPGGKYRHWDSLRHISPPEGLSTEEWWLAIKFARSQIYKKLFLLDSNGEEFRYCIPDALLASLHQIDKNASGAIGHASAMITQPETRDTYLIKSLMDEAITSSQLEGAATTREVAKDMMQRGRKPRNRGEQMILNNFNAMQSVRRITAEPLSPSIILDLQRILTENTLPDAKAAGRYRRPDEPITVQDDLGTVLHVPPAAPELPERMSRLCKFANATNEGSFVHPVIRAILLHFWLAYDHPFVDGNGRTARALFYWSMASQGYWLCEYLSISGILRKAPSKYSRAFLYSETDDNDATYFILYQTSVIIRAIKALHDYLATKQEEIRKTEFILRQSALLQATLNYRQIALVNHALKNPMFVYTIASHRNSHKITYQTARTDLLALAEFELLEKRKSGKKFVFISPTDLRKRIQQVVPRGRKKRR
ncbi:MAG: Fic family protein [Planctomycetes bacterium]|nr:Fic family protein [Planctomycetota bacterium]